MYSGIDPEVSFCDPTETLKCESITIGNIAWCNESWLQLFHTDGSTGEMDSHAEWCFEALLITVGVFFFSVSSSLLLPASTDKPKQINQVKDTKTSALKLQAEDSDGSNESAHNSVSLLHVTLCTMALIRSASDCMISV